MSKYTKAAERLADAVEAVLYLQEDRPGQHRAELVEAWTHFCKVADKGKP